MGGWEESSKQGRLLIDRPWGWRNFTCSRVWEVLIGDGEIKRSRPHGCSPGRALELGNKIFLFYLFLYKRDLFISLHWVSAVTPEIFGYSMWTLSCDMWDLVPWPGIKPGSPDFPGDSVGICLPMQWTWVRSTGVGRSHVPATFLYIMHFPTLLALLMTQKNNKYWAHSSI